jgi:hypothetical protein
MPPPPIPYQLLQEAWAPDACKRKSNLSARKPPSVPVKQKETFDVQRELGPVVQDE